MTPEILLYLLELIRNSLYVVTQFLHPTDYRFPVQATVQNGSRFDYIVVGAGTAGCIVANRLTEDNDVRVLLIEAGGPAPLESVYPAYFPYLPHTVHDWNYTSTNDNYSFQYTTGKVANLTIGRMLGGTSGLHHMHHVRGHPKDYNDWAKLLQDTSWNFKNFLPYLKKPEKMLAENILASPIGRRYGTNGELLLTKPHLEVTDNYLAAFAEVGVPRVIDLNGYYVVGYTDPVQMIANDSRQSSAEAFLRPIRDRSNLYVYMHTIVTNVLIDGNNNAIGVRAIDENNNVLVFYANYEVILSAGGLNTPKILMLSGVGPAEVLNRFNIEIVSDLPVGLNLMDHPGVVVVHNMGPSNIIAGPINPATTIGAPSFVGYGSFRNSKSYPDYQTQNLLFPPNPEDFSALFLTCNVLLSRVDICEIIREANVNNLILLTMLDLTHPKSRGKVEIGSADPKEPPAVELGQFSNEDDLTDLAKSIMHFLKVKNSTFFRNISAETLDFKLEGCKDLGGLEFWECYSLNIGTTFWHYSGTASLGSVVDNELRVKGVNKLRVTDGSVIPIINTGNINSPIMGIAEKASDLIKNSRNNK